MRLRPLLLVLLASILAAQHRPTACASCAAWNAPQEPFRVYGNTYYVGTHGLGAILIASDTGHVLIDGALPESAPQIAAHIRALGFDIKDVRLILNSHAHFDHAGGIAELQKLSGARVVASPWAAGVMKKGAVAHDDPQFGTIVPIASVARVETLRDGETLHAGTIAVTAHLTPGHTPGGTSWTWQSCENGRCLAMVYADSLTPVSADGFRFGRIQDSFERSYAFLESTPCDILLTPHPDVSSLWERLERHKSNPDALIDPGACRAFAERSREQLRKRLAAETAK